MNKYLLTFGFALALTSVFSIADAAQVAQAVKAPVKTAVKKTPVKPKIVPMPVSEASIGGIKTGMPLGEVVKKWGKPARKEKVEGDGVRAVIYTYNDYVRVVGRTAINDKSPEEALHVVSFTLKSNQYRTPSGFTCGTPLSKIEAKYGKGTRLVMPDGEVSYFYTFPNSNVELDFAVDEKKIVTKIYCGSEF